MYTARSCHAPLRALAVEYRHQRALAFHVEADADPSGYVPASFGLCLSILGKDARDWYAAGMEGENRALLDLLVRQDLRLPRSRG